MDADAVVARSPAGNTKRVLEAEAVGVLSLFIFDGIKDADNGSKHFLLALNLSLPKTNPFDGPFGKDRGVFLGER